MRQVADEASMPAHLDEDTVLEFLRGALSNEARSRVESHIDGCGNCRELLSALAGSNADTTSRPPGVLSQEPSVARVGAVHWRSGTVIDDRFEIEENIGRGGM